MGEGNYSFQRLEVWRDTMDLVRLIYQLTATFPKEESYGIVAQLRRAAVSIPANIAEGRGRFHKKEQVQFFYNARGSLYEVVTLLMLSTALGFLDQSGYIRVDEACQKALAKLSGLINSLKASPPPFTLHPSPA